MADGGILGSYWTTAGPAIPAGAPPPLRGPEWSPFSWRDRCAQAARVGLGGLGLWHEDLRHLLEVHSLKELGQIFHDAGLEVLELEFLMDWYLPSDDPRRGAADAVVALVFEAAAALGAHHVKVGNIFGVPVAHEHLVGSFAALCARAADEHDAPIVYELMPFDVNVDRLDKAIALVRDAGARNGGLALDTWHLGKLKVDASELAALPRRHPLYVELSDGTRASRADLSEETTSYRMLPGEGEFDLVGYVRAVRELGYQGPWGVEVLSARLRALPIDTLFDQMADATSTLLEVAASASLQGR